MHPFSIKSESYDRILLCVLQVQYIFILFLETQRSNSETNFANNQNKIYKKCPDISKTF